MQIIRYLVNTYSKLPVKPLRGPLSKLYKIYRLRLYSHNRNKIVIIKINGIKYQLDLNELIDRTIYYEGCFEPMTTALINMYVEEGMTVFDIGANIGCHTLLFAKLVGGDGKVIAFEPMSWAFLKLKRNIWLNDFNNVILERIALSNESKDNQMVHFSASWPLNGSVRDDIHPIHGGHIMKDIVNFVTLDEYVRRNRISRIDLIKLDVDGYEYKVIQGALGTLNRHKPTIIIEMGIYTLQEVGDNIYDLVNALSDIGYKFYSEKDLAKFPDNDTMIKSIPKHGTINVLCKGGGN